MYVHVPGWKYNGVDRDRVRERTKACRHEINGGINDGDRLIPWLALRLHWRHLK